MDYISCDIYIHWTQFHTQSNASDSGDMDCIQFYRYKTIWIVRNLGLFFCLVREGHHDCIDLTYSWFVFGIEDLWAFVYILGIFTNSKSVFVFGIEDFWAFVVYSKDC